MSSPLTKGVALGVAGALTPGSPYSFIYPGVVNQFTDTGSTWVRLWAHLPAIFPASGVVDWSKINLLAEQIFWAKYFGRGVILTMNQIPPWVNELDWGSTGGFQQNGKSPAQRFPDDVSTTSTWAGMVTILLSCWSTGSTRTNVPEQWRSGWIDILEIVNEPNLLMWPQTGDNRIRTAGCKVGQMMQTALTANSWFGNQTAIGGPAVTDATIDSTSDGLPAVETPDITRTGCMQFAEDFVGVFNTVNVTPGTRAVFTMHNYSDVGSPASYMRVARLRETKLRGQWAGYPNADKQDPHIWITEGGVTMDRLGQLGYTGASALAMQAMLVYNAFSRMKNNSTNQNEGGYGIDVTMNYLFLTDSGYDCGLVNLDGSTRPAYTTWKNM